jgi:hypothetical protein
VREIAALYENFHKIGHGSAPPKRARRNEHESAKKGARRHRGGRHRPRQWFAGLAATQQC